MIEVADKLFRRFRMEPLLISQDNTQEFNFFQQLDMMQIVVAQELLPDNLLFIDLALTACLRFISGALKIFDFFHEQFKISTILHFFQVLIFIYPAGEDQVRLHVDNRLPEGGPAELFTVNHYAEGVPQSCPVACM